MSTFSRKASTWRPQHKMVRHVSATFRPMTLKNKFKVFAVLRFNKITLPTQIASCEFLLIKHQRLIVLNEYLPPRPPSSEPASFLASWYWFSCKTALLLFPYIQYCSINWVKNQLIVIFIFVTRHWYAWLDEDERRRVNTHSALEHLNTVDTKKC